MKESAIIEPGSSILAPFETSVGMVGSMICFDLRFPEIALALKRQHADILLYPSAFTVPYVFDYSQSPIRHDSHEQR